LRDCGHAGHLRTALQCHVVASHALLMNRRPHDALQECERAMLRIQRQEQDEQQQQLSTATDQQEWQIAHNKEHVASLTQHVFVIAAMAYRTNECRNEEAVMLELAMTTLAQQQERDQENAFRKVNTLPRTNTSHKLVGDTLLRSLRAESLLSCGRRQDALKCFEGTSSESFCSSSSVFATEPRAPPPDALRCFLLLDQSRFDQALSVALALLDVDDRDWTARLYAADALASLGRPSEAVPHLQAIVCALSPQSGRLTPRMLGILNIAENNLAVACSVVTSTSSQRISPESVRVVPYTDDSSPVASPATAAVVESESFELLQRAGRVYSPTTTTTPQVNMNANRYNLVENTNTCMNILSVFNLIVLLWDRCMYRQACVLWLKSRGVSLELSSVSYTRIRQELEVLQRVSPSTTSSSKPDRTATKVSFVVCAPGSFVVDSSGPHAADVAR
jgi:hypothetical protein